MKRKSAEPSPNLMGLPTAPKTYSKLRAMHEALISELRASGVTVGEITPSPTDQFEATFIPARRPGKTPPPDALPPGSPDAKKETGSDAQLAQLAKLREEIARLEPIWREHRDKDYWWWRAKIYDDLAALPDFNPEEVSVRRLHYAAQSAMADVGRYEELVASLRQMTAE